MISTVVWRQEGFRLDPIVLIRAEETPTVKTVSNLQDAVVRALTKWVIGTEDGKKAWEYSGGDFNIGDLSSYLSGDPDTDDTELLRYLEEEGVKNLSIESLDTDSEWNYDTVLVDSGDIDAAQEDKE